MIFRFSGIFFFEAFEDIFHLRGGFVQFGFAVTQEPGGSFDLVCQFIHIGFPFFYGSQDLFKFCDGFGIGGLFLGHGYCFFCVTGSEKEKRLPSPGVLPIVRVAE